MEHVKLFNAHSEYEDFLKGENYIEPHVSYCKEDGCVQYNYKKEGSIEMVDLGLPSGLLWAKCNVGATSEEEYGLYFQWGDTVGYTGDDAKAHSYWTTAPFNGGNEIDDEASINQAIADDKIDATSGILKPQYDAATVHMGANYHMPTYGDCQELIEETNQEIAEINGVQGMKYINKSDSSKYIFIPFAGDFYEGEGPDAGEYGDVWSSSLCIDGLNGAAYFYYDNDSVIYVEASTRAVAICVRGVLGASDQTPFSIGGPA